MASPVEFRYFLGKFSMDDFRNGFQPVKQFVGPQNAVEYFKPPQLQYRYKERVIVNGAPLLEWSEWADVPMIREGEEASEPAQT